MGVGGRGEGRGQGGQREIKKQLEGWTERIEEHNEG